eukprot:TRINITY_DN47037_c0_g1_i1.p1 TRINITY_DN47037_c0_g1~~TRINITY_DN47037_c0_g1_i1.p1  ORF type:complete len:367 (+),score=131.87 TRINITY_DN47037_c0_g1_i1:72-1103(+)
MEGGARVSAVLAGSVLALSLACNVFPALIPLTAFVPSSTLTGHFYIWNIFTGFAVETWVVAAVPAAVVVAHVGGAVEHVWGSVEFVKFTAAVAAMTHATVLVYVVIKYVAGTEGLFYMYFSGGTGLAQAVLVAQAQLHGDDRPFAVAPLRWRHVPAALALAGTVWELAAPRHVPSDAEIGEGRPLLRGTWLFHAILSPWYAWAYLRFFQRYRPAQTVPGDVSAQFAFRNFFPGPLELPAGVIANAAFALASLAGFGAAVRDAAAARAAGGEGFGALGAGGELGSAEKALTAMGTNPTDADRRRQVALAALNERMAAVHSASQNTSLQGFDVEAPARKPDTSQL